MEKKFVRFSLTLFVVFGLLSPITSNATSPDPLYATVSDTDYEKAELLTILEDNLQKLGLSFRTLTQTNINFQNINLPTKAHSLKATTTATTTTTKSTTNLSFNLPQIRHLARRIYGDQPSNDQMMYTFMTYYIDVSDDDREGGKIGFNLPYSYFPTYLTDNDIHAYDAFLRSAYGKKWIECADSTYDLAKGVSTISETIRNTSLEDLKNSVSSVENMIENLQKIYDLNNSEKALKTFFTDATELNQIHSLEELMTFISEKISADDSIETASKEAIESVFGSVLSQVFITIGNATPTGLLAITTMYEASMMPLYLSIYDQAAINTLHYTRSTRLVLRQYQSWGL